MQISRIRLSDKTFTPSPTTRRAQDKQGKNLCGDNPQNGQAVRN
jgi:hypothetical protein